MKTVIALCLAVLLSACQSRNPYTAQSAPMPPAPTDAATQFDASAYPAAPVDYSGFKSWRWGSDPHASVEGGTVDNLREAIANGLEQRGLRPAAGNAADLLINASLRTERRVRQVQDSYGSYGNYGGYYGGGPYYRDRYGVGASIPITRSYEYEVGVLRLELQDAAGQAIWNGSSELSLQGDASDRRKALYDAAHKVLENYPPN